MKYCCFGKCISNSRVGRPGYDPAIKFYPFPKPCLELRDNVLNWDDAHEKRHVNRCEKCRRCWKWMLRCKRSDSRFQSVRFTTNAFICSKHFQDPPAVMDYEKYLPSATVKAVSGRAERYRAKQSTSFASQDSTNLVDDQPNDISEETRPTPFFSSIADLLVPTANEVIFESVPIIDDVLPPYDITCEASPIQISSTRDLLDSSNDVILEAVPFLIDQQTQAMIPEPRVECTSIGTQTDLYLDVNRNLEAKISSLNFELERLQLEIIKLKKIGASSVGSFERKLSQNDKMCKFYTGLSIKELDLFHKFCQNIKIQEYWGNKGSSNSSSNRRSGIEPNSTSDSLTKNKFRAPNSSVRKLTQTQELLLMFLRLRGGLLLEDIAYRFGLTVSLISRVVTTWIKGLYETFFSMRKQMFPSRDMIKKHLPARFKKKEFNNLRVIIDCAEFFCEKPSNFEQQGNSYSDYKAHTTYKVLLGCSPNGAVTFISDLFEGSISDRAIVEQSGLIEFLDEGDVILADRGFTIRDMTDAKGIKLKIPAFLKGRDKLSPQEEIQTKEIASNRIFIEHIVGRLKSFRYLQRTEPQNMRHILSQAVYVCACILNFRPPLLK